MAKGPIVSKKIKQDVAAIYRAHPDWLVKEVQREIDKITNGRAPGISSIQKIMVEIKRKEAEEPFINQDRPWSLGTLNESPEYLLVSQMNAIEVSQGYRWVSMTLHSLQGREPLHIRRRSTI